MCGGIIFVKRNRYLSSWIDKAHTRARTHSLSRERQEVSEIVHNNRNRFVWINVEMVFGNRGERNCERGKVEAIVWINQLRCINAPTDWYHCCVQEYKCKSKCALRTRIKSRRCVGIDLTIHLALSPFSNFWLKFNRKRTGNDCWGYLHWFIRAISYQQQPNQPIHTEIPTGLTLIRTKGPLPVYLDQLLSQ